MMAAARMTLQTEVAPFISSLANVYRASPNTVAAYGATWPAPAALQAPLSGCPIGHPGRRLPAVLSEEEIEKLIGAREPGETDRAGWRDRALIETKCIHPDCGSARPWR
jgi:hypothetical protein